MANIFTKWKEKRRLKRSFKEYGYTVKTFDIPGLGTVEYAQWLHPFEGPKTISLSNINFYRKLTSDGGMIIDIGAHTGDTTVPMALAVGEKGLVLGLEPNPYVHKILAKNSTLNPSLTNIVPLCFAATATEGEFVFNYSDASFCNGGFLSQIRSKSHHHNYTLKVEGKNLESFLLENYNEQLSKLQLIKIDAEGYDKEILKTIPGIIEKFKPNMMVECYKKLTTEEREELYDIIDHFGYDLYYLENFEESGKMVKIERDKMRLKKHFEMLALPR